MIAALPKSAMTEPAWIIKWRARDALKNGQPEEAQRLLDALIASGNRRAFALRDDVVRGFIDRADRLLRQGNVEAAWSDLQRVEKLAPTDGGVGKLREGLIQRGLAEIRDALEAGNPLQALRAATRLKERPAKTADVASLEQAAQEWVLAGEMAERGEFPPARSAVEGIRARLDRRTAGLDRFEQDLVRREDRFRTAWTELQEAVAGRDSRATLRLADEVLAAAPRHKDAQQARNRAWQAVQSETVPYRPSTKPSELSSAPGVVGVESTREADSAPAKRYILWIDGVGAWLVCLASRISIGQATPEGGPIDVPLLADVSRIHASLSRDEESYLLETTRDVLVNGQPAAKAVLRSGDRLSFSTCAMTFTEPVPGCRSALLTLEGARRLPMAVDGVLLMADMLVLGPGEKVHVQMPDLAEPLYLFRQKDRLGVRWAGEFTVEGEKVKDRAMLPAQGCVSSESFAFALEALGRPVLPRASGERNRLPLAGGTRLNSEWSIP